MKEKALVTGKVVQAVGPIIDVEFKNQHLPELLTALKIEVAKGQVLTVEVAQHIGDDVVRTVAMGPTEGVVRGMEVISTEKPIEVPVGRPTLGRMFNVFGEPIDKKPAPKSVLKKSIHAEALPLNQRKTHPEIFISGIKAIAISAPRCSAHLSLL